MKELAQKVSGKAKQIDRKIGHRILKHNSGLMGHLASNLVLRRARLLSDVEANSDGQTEQLKEKGQINLGAVSDGNIEDIHTTFQRLLEEDEFVEESTFNGKTHLRQLDSENFSFRKHFPEIGDLVSDEIKAMLQRYYGSYCKPVAIRVKRNLHREPLDIEWGKEAWLEYPIRVWHIDDIAPDLVRVFVLLDDVDENCGPTQWVPHDTTRRLWNKYKYFTVLGEPGGVIDQEGDVHTSTGSAGDVIVMHPSKVFHRAGNPAPGKKRDVVQFTFAPSDKPLPNNWIHDEDKYISSIHNYGGIGRVFHP